MNGQPCTTCGGRGAVANAATGSPEPCPNCESYLSGTVGLPFWYLFSQNPANPAAFALTALQANVGASVQIDNDSDFLCDRIIGSRTGAYNAYLKDNFSARLLSPSQNVPIADVNFVGTAQLPYWLPKPWLIKRTSTVQGFFTDTSGAGNTIQLILAGYKVT